MAGAWHGMCELALRGDDGIQSLPVQLAESRSEQTRHKMILYKATNAYNGKKLPLLRLRYGQVSLYNVVYVHTHRLLFLWHCFSFYVFLYLMPIILDTGVIAGNFQFKETQRICNLKQLYNSGDKRHSIQVSMLQLNYVPVATTTNTLLNLRSSHILEWSRITIHWKYNFRRRRVLTLRQFSEGREENHGISYSR
jgi:hypothetical protein